MATLLTLLITLLHSLFMSHPYGGTAATPLSCTGWYKYAIYDTLSGKLEPGYFDSLVDSKNATISYTDATTGKVVILTRANVVGYGYTAQCDGGKEIPMSSTTYQSLQSDTTKVPVADSATTTVTATK